MQQIYDTVVVGTGAAGLTAGLYLSRAKLNALLLEKETIGGELMNRDLIENYPGYSDGIIGSELGSNMMVQVMNYEGEIQLAEVSEIKLGQDYKEVKTAQGDYLSRTVIIAGGAHPKKLGIAGEEEFSDKGVFYCATCDGPHFAGKVVAVAGGGDSGITEGLHLTQYVSKVIVIEIMPELNATKILQERASANPKIEIRCGTKIEAILGDTEVKELSLADVKTGESYKLEVDGILVHIGLDPNTDYLKGTVPLDSKGQILVNAKMETEIPGIFAAGDIRSNSPMQVSTAVGDGATAALSAQRYLKGL
ncbi:NAD(P)/FAD-dependent oxidoreductase [Chloroflexota bacterium]